MDLEAYNPGWVPRKIVPNRLDPPYLLAYHFELDPFRVIPEWNSGITMPPAFAIIVADRAKGQMTV